MRELFSDLERQAFLQVTSADRFAGEAAVVAGRLIQIHPFRDGNGRTTRYFLDELARRAGHKLNLGVAPNQHVRDRWMSASEEFLRPYPNYTPMAQFLSDTIKGRVQSAEHRIVLSEAITKRAVAPGRNTRNIASAPGSNHGSAAKPRSPGSPGEGGSTRGRSIRRSKAAGL